ncbi:hypothetical protein PENANT_c007G00014 [Penicillium antarcticum]|uniref:Cullin family profile domain-containing protein n=1 Tax=Penicillium antarcticum TaxID=416450 RepID=A0A1V6QCJ8_9EURO|nr:uncharacterized protein N7508_003546 [Penicillium antarcticum]KAJ5312716.1 hypothetical protein N7508_003546 [Penicillium antarcticum]OQD86717.1 hypothetical protein PENANT_c007G00014 [Penicillium antarcticum]
MQRNSESGKRHGKRKLSASPQRSISDLLSSKRPRRSPSPSPTRKPTLPPPTPIHNHSQNQMHQFSSSPPRNGAPLRGASSGPGPGLNNVSVGGVGVPGRPQSLNVGARQSNFSPHTGAKKLVVKNLRLGPRLNQESYFDKVWSQLDAALTAVFDGRKPESSLEELYKGGENICRQERAAVLAQRLQGRCRDYVNGKMREGLIARAGGSADVDTLRAVLETWSAWHSRLVTVRWIFYYLDQSFLLHSKDQPVIREMGLIQFRSYIFNDASLKPKILKGAYNLIAADRGADVGALADSALLREAMDLFHNLDVYSSDFEPLLMSETEKFVTSWCQREVAENLATYVDSTRRLIEREVERCNLFSFARSTRLKLSELLDETLIVKQTDLLTNDNDVLALMRAGNKDALQQLYNLLARRDLTLQLKSAFKKYIVEEGEGIVFDQENEAHMVVNLLQFKRKADDIWSTAFDSNEELGHTLREAFGIFMNRGKKMESTGGTDNPKAGEMIAKYVDRLLKGGLKVSSEGQQTLIDEDAELDRQMDQVLDLFRFVHGKAVFEAFYKNDLARRLLMGRSASSEAEKSMLARLKNECGSNFTHNLESMFNDMDTAKAEMVAFDALQKQRSHKERTPVPLHVSVLSAASWPSYPDVTVRIPSKIAKSINNFEAFYQTKHKGRKLDWKHQLSHCQLNAYFPKANGKGNNMKNLVVSSFQAIVLLLFNDVPDGESLDYTQIQEATGLSDPELKRTLQSVACAKYKVLIKSPKGKDVKPTDKFWFNAGFTDPQTRIKINQIQLKETKEENKTTHERISADRHLETQAAIVRLMKSRKVLGHAELISEVLNATKSRGALQPSEIKGEIEKLIEKDYMERKEGTNAYSYVA